MYSQLRRSLALTTCAMTVTLAIGVSAQGDIPLVRVDAVRSEPLAQTVPVLGRLVPRQAGVVSARLGGPVEAYNVEVGESVEAGDVLAVLTSATLRANRDLAKAGLARVEAALGTRQAELALAQQELKRLEGMQATRAVSRKSVDDQRQQVVISNAQIAEAKAAVAEAQAELALKEIDVSYAEIRAPYTGVITERLSEAGAYLQAGDSVVRMVSNGELEIEADVPYERLSGLERGTQVRVNLADGTTHIAEVRALVPEENPLTRTRAVRFVTRFGDTLKPLAARQSVTVQVPVGAPRQVLTVHKDAVIKGQGGATVFVVEDEAANPRQVRLGEAVGNRFEVLDSLNEGDRVVVRGNERLRPGDKVQIDDQS